MAELVEYKCNKEVKAKPMTYHEAGKLGLVRDYNEDAENQEGYYVVYSDGYESWSPKKTFEDGYVKKDTHSKTLDIKNTKELKEKVNDIKVFGDPDTWKLISKASSASQGWMKSTKGMEIYGLGVVLQVSTQQGDNVAEAVTFIPGAGIENILKDERVVGRQIVKDKYFN